MADISNIPIFHGSRIEDLDQDPFVCEVVWTVNQVQYDATKIA